jgi:hypothetical protein
VLHREHAFSRLLVDFHHGAIGHCAFLTGVEKLIHQILFVSDNALAAYKDFLTLWKDADPDIPILKQAKAEYAKLQ